MDNKDIEKTIDVAIRALTYVSDNTNIEEVPTIKKGNDSFSVFPMLSGMDGQLVDGNYYDFSIYSDYVSSGESEDKNVAIAREILLESQAVQYYISMGMSVQYTGQIDEIEGRP